MRLRTFFAEAGDCLLLSSADGKHILIDGGPKPDTFDVCTLPSLYEIQRNSEELDLVIISHIDDDHIDGILRLLDLYSQAAFGISSAAGATLEVVPTITAVWHNSWSLDADRLVPRVRPREGPGAWCSPFQGGVGMERIDRNLPLIKRNSGFRGDLVALTSSVHVEPVGARLELTVIGPNQKALKRLRSVFENEFLHRPAAARIAARIAARLRRAVARPDGPTAHTTPPMLDVLAVDQQILAALGDQSPVRAPIGDESDITAANRASIIVLASETSPGHAAPRTCLLTGDASASDVLGGLRKARQRKDGAPFRCDILKLQHHGASANFSADFAAGVVARHYVVSGNGLHDNPEPAVMALLVAERARVAADQPFCVWFTCTAERAAPPHRRAMHAGLDAAVQAARIANSAAPGLATVRVLNGNHDYFDICLCDPTPRGSCGCIPAEIATTDLTALHR